MNTIMQDIRYALRVLRKSPGFAAIAILTLALGIGANTAIFSIVDAMLLRPLPVKNAAGLVMLSFQQKLSYPDNRFSMAAYRDLQAQTTGVFSDIVAYQFGIDGFSFNGKPERVMTCYVSGNFFEDLGLQPALGRLIMPNEGQTPGADPIVVLSYAYWQSQFGGDPSIVGKSLLVDGHPVTIIGVAPQGFDGVHVVLRAQAFMPVAMQSFGGVPAGFMENRKIRNEILLAHLRPGVSIEQANATLAVVAQRMAQADPDTEKDLSLRATLERLSRPNPDPSRTMVIAGTVFLALAAMVMLLACMNVANILLVRATVREREMAIRTALGAGRARLVRQMLTESVLLALGGGIAGIALGQWASAAMSSMDLQTDLPVRINFGMDWRIFAYAFGAALVNGLIIGLVPAVRAARSNINSVLHGGGRGIVGGTHRMRDMLVAAQVAGSLAVLIVAGLFARSLVAAQHSKLGFDASRVADLTMDPHEIGYTTQQTAQFYRNLLEQVRALPGVQSAAIAGMVPLGYYGNYVTMDIPGYQPQSGQAAPAAPYNPVSPGYFETLSTPILRGRAFTEADNEQAPFVAVINEAMAKKYWPNQDPLGHSFRYGGIASRDITIVGVVGDTRIKTLRGPFELLFYLPFAQHADTDSLETLQVRTVGPPAPMIPLLEQTIHGIAPDLPVFDVKTMRDGMNSLNGFLIYEFGAFAAGAMGLLGLTLAIVGVYGVVSYAASLRTHEIGIRMALGAQRFDVLRMIFGRGMLIVGVGVALGIAAALAAGQIVGNFLTVPASDPLTYLAVSAILVAVALAACFIPARRAMRVDPMVALRYE